MFSSLDGLRGLPRTLHQRVRGFLPWLEVAGLLCLVVAMSRPQSGRADGTVTTRGIAIQLVIDRSDSMNAEDLDPDPNDHRRVTRLDVVKAVVEDFVDESGDLPGRPNDVVGLVSFAGYPKVHCPLTLDHQMLTGVLHDVEVPRITRREDKDLLMTAMGDALVMSVKHLDGIEAETKIVVLLSDGASNVGAATPAAGANDAADQGVKVYTVGIGTVGKGLDEDALKAVAARTGGQYFNARSAADLQSIYKQIDQLSRSDFEVFSDTDWDDRFPWYLVAGLLLLVVHRVLSDTRYRSLP